MFGCYKMNFFTLKFKSPEIESIFLDYYYNQSIRHIRVALFFGLFLYVAFGFLDPYVIPEATSESWFIRYVIFTPYITLVIISSFCKYFKNLMQSFLFTVILLGGMGIIVITIHSNPRTNYLYYAGLIIVIMFSYTFLKLRFIYASIATWTLVILYEIISFEVVKMPTAFFINNTFFLISANLIGMSACYQMEVSFRNNFIQQLTIKELGEKRRQEEKEMIMKDLHDGIGGIMTNISLLTEISQRKPDLIGDRSDVLTTIAELSREAISELRMVINNLDSKDRDWHDFAADLKNFGGIILSSHGISFSIHTSVTGPSEAPNTVIYLNLLRIYKEALTNVIKHSFAHNVIIDFDKKITDIVLKIHDDGMGIPAEGPKGRGILNMRKRAQEIGAQIDINGAKGTTIIVAVPLT